MVLLIIIGLFIFGIFNFKFRQLALMLTLLLFFNKQFRRNIALLSMLFLLGLRNKSARQSAFRNSKKMIKRIITI